MKGSAIIVLVFCAALAMTASEDVCVDRSTLPSEIGYRFYGPYDIFKPRPLRWQSKPQERTESNQRLGQTIPRNDPEYLAELINYLQTIGRR